MKIDRKKVIDEFASYVKKYDDSDGKIKLKIDHTYRVADICEKIAVSLKLSSEQIDLAWVLGMLHDLGRFEQLRQYGTFVDRDSIDHAHFAVELLYDREMIFDYICIEKDEKEYGIIKSAIWNHSAYRIEENLDDETQMFCHILRDADKVDIFKVACDTPLNVIYGVPMEIIKKQEITKEVMEQFLAHRAIIRETKRTCVDNIVGHIALYFELVYSESRNIAKNQGYIIKLLDFQSENEKTMEQFAVLRKCLQELEELY